MKNHRHSPFLFRHIGITPDQYPKMLETLAISQPTTLFEQALPSDCHLETAIPAFSAQSETELQQDLQALGQQNRQTQDHLGQGYYPAILPSPIRRHVLENPNWYTAYTPYQSEISQGRLEGLFYFQTLVQDLTGLPIANASLLDEATAAAEAMLLAHRKKRNAHENFFVDANLHPQIIRVIQTRAKPLNIPLIIEHIDTLPRYDVFGVIQAYCQSDGQLIDPTFTAMHLRQIDAIFILHCDPMALLLLKPPSEYQADIAIGHLQRFGLPVGFGGPHPAFIATTIEFQRHLPGRIIGQSVDSHQQPVFRMALQTREQHIRREKATSNICTAQALLANMVSFYAMYHGAQGLTDIATRIHAWTKCFYRFLQQEEYPVITTAFFDTLTVDLHSRYEAILEKLQQQGIEVRQYPNTTYVSLSFNETTQLSDIQKLTNAFSQTQDPYIEETETVPEAIPLSLQRSPFVFSHDIFESHHSETEFLRYLKRLEVKDYTLCQGMIPLGSCTMKLNAVTELESLSDPSFIHIHPFTANENAQGYFTLMSRLEARLCQLTGFDRVSFQPNSGAQGEYAGLLAIRAYHHAQQQPQRKLCFIPKSAHGTNPASAQLAGFDVINIPCDAKGNIDLQALTLACQKHGEHLAAMMITYPSTHGIFEPNIREVCQLIHQHGGQVYLDGANLNAQLGLTTPAYIGADVSHFNLHKTFCIPHGGGGPGMGPIGVKNHLAPYLPNENTISATPYGSASLLTISYAYIEMMGSEGIALATQTAILNANYIMKRLENAYPILYRGNGGWIAHECLFDIRPITQASGITEEDIAKRLMDFGFHAPTMSFPVKGTLMVEPTESESLFEINRFCEAMLSIRSEIEKVISGQWPKDNNPLVNAPHTQRDLWGEDWAYPYTRELACFPTEHTKQHKYWPTVNRIDNAYGDRCLLCR